MSIFFGNATVGDREKQEDAYKVVSQSDSDPSSDVLMIVADGMGGHAGGEVASNLAVQQFETHFISASATPKPRDRLLESAHAANKVISDSIAADPKLAGMGCTLVGALKLNDRLAWVSIGDSHVYLFRDGTLTKLNEDHSVYGELMVLVKAEKLTAAEAAANPRRNALRSALIGKPLSLIDLNSTQLQHGDLVVIATDGLDSIDQSKIREVLTTNHRCDVEKITTALLDAVRDKGGQNQDNTTIVSYRHIQAGRSMWADDSKWKIPSNTNGGFNGDAWGPATRYITIILGFALLALAVVLLALPSRRDETPLAAPVPATVRTESQISNGEGPADIVAEETAPKKDDAVDQPQTIDGIDEAVEEELEGTPSTDADNQELTDPSSVPVDENVDTSESDG